MKKIVAGFIMAAFVSIALLPVSASAASKQEIKFETDENATEVTLDFSEAAERENMYSLSLSLKLETAASQPVEAEFVFSEPAAKVAEYRYSKEKGIMNIYLSSGDESLFKKNEAVLKLGSIVVSDNQDVKISVEENALKTVMGNKIEILENVSYVFEDKQDESTGESESNESNESTDTDEGTGESESNESNESTDTDEGTGESESNESDESADTDESTGESQPDDSEDDSITLGGGQSNNGVGNNGSSNLTGGENSDNKSEGVKTGDSVKLWLLMTIFVVSGVVCGCIGYLKKSFRKH